MKKVKVILLRKRLHHSDFNIEEGINNSFFRSMFSHWISLGNVDDIFIYTLDISNGFLTSIQEDKKITSSMNNSSNYYHSLYLVPYSSKEEKPCECKFVAIVRIHFSESLAISKKFNKISGKINNLMDSKKVNCNFYYATEFSDMVLDIRSNNFNDLVTSVLKIRNTNDIEIGKMYSYFGINESLLRDNTLSVDKNDNIPFLSIRLSGDNITLAKKQISLLESSINQRPYVQHVISGIDDFELIYKNLPILDIVNLYRVILYDNRYKNYHISESTITVGIGFTNSDIKPNYKPDSALIDSKFCKELPTLCKEIDELNSRNKKNAYYGWLPAIFEIANSLVRMSRTPIMDEIVYLVAPGIRAFLFNVLLRLKQTTKEYYLDYPDFYDYVDSCSFFIEQLMRIEGQLSSQPEIRPVIYDIPVFMLEYTIAFLNKVSKILQSNDELKKDLNTVFFLVPRPCKLVKATELFSAMGETPGLVHLQIPEGALFAPKKIFLELCHEISHYVGEKYRQRELRKEYYSYAVASVACVCFFGYTNDELIETIRDFYIKRLGSNLTSEPTIREMHNEVNDATFGLFSSNDCITALLKEYYLQCKTKIGEIIPIPIFGESIYGQAHSAAFQDFDALLFNVDTLFREVYADICSLCILNVDESFYIETLLSEVQNLNPDIEEILAIRIFVCLSSMKRDVKYSGEAGKNIWSKLIMKIRDIQSSVFTGEMQESGTYIPDGVIVALLKYAESCYDLIKESISKSDRDSILSMYQRLSDDKMRYIEMLKSIEKCREEMINDR